MNIWNKVARSHHQSKTVVKATRVAAVPFFRPLYFNNVDSLLYYFFFNYWNPCDRYGPANCPAIFITWSVAHVVFYLNPDFCGTFGSRKCTAYFELMPFLRALKKCHYLAQPILNSLQPRYQGFTILSNDCWSMKRRLPITYSFSLP